MNDPNAAQPSTPGNTTQPSDQPQRRPWRTEGLPKGEPAKRRRWTSLAVWGAGYLILFGLLTLQDTFSRPEAVPYTEFKAQVAAANVAEVFARGDTIEGALKKPAPMPKQQGRTYQQFKTERPTFAADDLLKELSDRKSTRLNSSH